MRDDGNQNNITPRRKSRLAKFIALGAIGLGSLLIALVASYFFYGMYADSKLGNLVYTPADQATPTPSAEQTPTPLDPSKMMLFPGSEMNPKYWNAPLWAGTDPIPATGLPVGFKPIDTQVTAKLHSLPAATRIQIPIIGLDSTVEQLSVTTLQDVRQFERPNKDVGHIPETGNPGEDVRGWYFGHLESPILGQGNIFHDLPKLPELMREGNSVFIILDTPDNSYVYLATSTEVVPQDDLIVTEDSGAEITLVTCVPALTYDHRLLVNAKLVGVKSSN